MCTTIIFCKQGIIVGGDVCKLQESLHQGYPSLQFIIEAIPHDLTASHSQPKRDYTKLTAYEARCLLYETLRSMGFDPSYVLPRRQTVQWQLNDVKKALLVSIIYIHPHTWCTLLVVASQW